MRTLIVGYGNTARRDDGAGWFVVRQLSLLDLAGVDFDTRHQLEVELAETLAAYDLVIFADAATPDAPEPIERRAVAPHFQPDAGSHYVTPGDVLGLCQSLYGRAPQALLFSIRGRDFGFGNSLSAGVEEASREVVRQITNLLSPTANDANQQRLPGPE